MNDAYLQFMPQSMHALTIVALLMVRMLVAFSMLPMFAAASVPVTVRTAFTAGLALCLLPVVISRVELQALTPGMLMMLTVKEAGIGAVLGLLGSLVFYSLQVAGSMIEMQSGLSMAALIDPNSGHESSLISSLFQQLFSILFIVTGGLLAYIGMLFESYSVWPLQTLVPAFDSARLATLIVSSFAGMLWLAIKIAVPFVVLLLLVELAVGFLSRMVPQANAFFLSLPLKVLLLGVLLLAFCTVLAGSPASVFNATTYFQDVLFKVRAVAGGT
ncbi:MAG TPA: flagellar biosynthetic protein FliR [Rhodocyclaceae bacterium]|nr:flagellar biosynthetic protein FliR [Rhodocyclaceae bacterium]